MTIPSIDVNTCGTWTEQDINFYNKLPFYLAKATTQFRKYWPTWPKLLNNIPWTPNQGDTMLSVMVEPTPVLRQGALPPLLREMPQQDIVNVRERTVPAKLRSKQFLSPHFNYLPAFQDFMRGNIKPTRENLDRYMLIYEEMFYRWHIWGMSPYVYFAGTGNLVAAPQADLDNNNASTGGAAKDNAWIQNQLASPSVGGKMTNLTFKELFKAMNLFEQESGATPFEGSGQPGGDSGPLNEMFALVLSSVTWNEFLDDPWLKENRPLNMNIVTESFKGNLFNKIRCKIERYGMRLKIGDGYGPGGTDKNGNANSTYFPGPEIVNVNPNDPEYGRTLPNKEYGSGCQLAVSYLVGGPSYDIIQVGPPPQEFASGAIPEGFGKMNWNGQVIMTKNFLVPCIDANGNNTLQTNSFGHYLRLQAETALGIVGRCRWNILPIVHLQKTGITTLADAINT